MQVHMWRAASTKTWNFFPVFRYSARPSGGLRGFASSDAPATGRRPLRRLLESHVYDCIEETALDAAPRLTASVGANVLLKREDSTSIFSFKIRGAYNKFAHLSESERERGVAACSAGNHAQGVALAAARMRVNAKIFMPLAAPGIKVETVCRLLGPGARLRVLADPDIVRGVLNDVPGALAHMSPDDAGVTSQASQVILVGNSFDECQTAFRECVEKEGRVAVPPFDDLEVIDGQGTVGLEVLRQCRNFDAIFVPIGGGGLAAGVASAVKAVRPEVMVIGVEAADAAGMTASLLAGEVVTLPHVGLFADGAAVARVGDLTFGICRELLDATIVVSTDHLCGAIKDAFGDTRTILEPAGALALAGLLKLSRRCDRGPVTVEEGDRLVDQCFAYVKDRDVMTQFVQAFSERGAMSTESQMRQSRFPAGRDMSIVAICSGANMDFDRLRFVSEFADRRESLLSVSIPERPGSFVALYEAVYPRSVTEFVYRISEDASSEDGPVVGQAHLLMSMHAFSREDLNNVVADLGRRGFEATDMTANATVKVHGRHLAAGRRHPARRTADRGEQLLRFEFPERPGALKLFLTALDSQKPTPNVSLFHYRSHGHDVASVLVAVECDSEAAHSFARGVGFRYEDESKNPFYRQFLV